MRCSRWSVLTVFFCFCYIPRGAPVVVRSNNTNFVSSRVVVLRPIRNTSHPSRLSVIPTGATPTVGHQAAQCPKAGTPTW
ncbi:hypothetical protein BD626DRAFT_501913 [Schizophyllum amplum]|uniref:Secreted protein n=1 Tax=Schizophyllum amplum TaxID=97359 RepID=A0A550C984_9AGAR|nr:hypothetical protein BD626DRAFT_501913 [Auriculariopsis ampla]